jgi:pyruvate dehydrogenase (quinone)
MRRWRPSWHARTQSSPGSRASATRPPVRGAIHLLNGLYDAKADHIPVVAIVGQQARAALGSSYQQEVNLQALFSDVTEYVMTATVPGQVRTVVDRAVRIAQARRAVTCIILPNDLQEETYEDLPMAHGATHTGVGFPAESNLPNAKALQRAAGILNEGKKVAMLVGAGCLGATDEVIAVAEVLGAGVAKSLVGKAAVPDDLRYVTGRWACWAPSPRGT